MNDEQWEKDAEANAKIIRQQIESLKYGHWSLGNRNYKDFWEQVKQINHSFKSPQPFRREDREKLWETYQAIIHETKQAQNAEHEKRHQQSKDKRELVEMTINEAGGYVNGARSPSDISKAKDLLNLALQRMKKGWDGFSATTRAFALSDGQMTKEDNDACWEKWKDVKESLKYRQEEMFDLNYNHFRAEAYEAKGLADSYPREAKAKVKEVQAGLKTTYMRKDQFEIIREILNDAWRRASGEQERKQFDWKERKESQIIKMHALIEKNQSVISKIETDIDHCEDLANNARSADFESQVRGWIDEKRNKIDDTRTTNRELEEKIRSIQDKLR